ncbi:tetratricopeptide repeat protein [Alicyclobacillus sp. SO9]|nr:tetratricopeptide repeat protein [Alicyclobacillus sp. SO9]
MLRTGNNVIDMRLDAAYFFERGVHFLERNHLSKALRAFQRTIEYEPENPVNHFNLAGVLSEMGDFEASNKVLLHVLNDLDPTMAECQFYLANNYANMGEYEAAEEHVLRYLDSDPDGEYAPDAEEMLALLVDEFGGGRAYERWRESQAEKERSAAHRDGRHLLEAGHFEAAVEYLEDIIQDQPDNLAAMNNLSLAYYYTAMHDEAIATTERVLEIQPDNIHALCNLTVYSIHQGPKARLYECVDKLRRVFPLHYDQAMKVGTTLGLVGDHETALQMFTVLAKLVEIPDAALMHSIAAAAANTGRFATARKWWKQLRQLPDLEAVADYHLDRLDTAVNTNAHSLRVSYQYDLPIENQFAEMKRRLNSAQPSEWQDDPVLRASMYWGLRHGNGETRRAVIRTLAIIGDEDAQKALRLFVRRTDVSQSIRQVALSALKICDPNGMVEYYDGTQIVKQPLDNLPWEMLLQVDSQWSAIWQQTQAMLHKKNCTDCHLPAKTAWLGFLKRLFIRNDVRVIKPEVWVAGLVYLAIKGAGQKTSQKEVAESLGVSVSSLRKASRRLQTYFPLNK